MAKEKEPKIELERIYNIPLRKSWLKVAKYKRAKKAVKALKEFLAKHMKVEDRDLKNVKLDTYLNEEIWFRGIKKPPAKIKVKAVKLDDGIVKAELLEIPEILKFKIAKEQKEKDKAKTEKEKKKAEQAAREAAEKGRKEEKTEEQKKDEEEKEKSTIEAGLEKQKQLAKQEKHIKGAKQVQKHQFRKALQK